MSKQTLSELVAQYRANAERWRFCATDDAPWRQLTEEANAIRAVGWEALAELVEAAEWKIEGLAGMGVEPDETAAALHAAAVRLSALLEEPRG